MASAARDPSIEPSGYSAPLRRFSRAEYDSLVESGFFAEDEKVELLDGVITSMTPQGHRHSAPILRLNMLLAPALAGRAAVGVQLPFAASDVSEPEPDLFIVPLSELEDDGEHPSQAYCIIEISVTSQARDRAKVGIYARANVPQLILIDVQRREARIYRGPRDGDYKNIQTLDEGARVVIDAFPDVGFDLAAVLPKSPAT